MIQPIERVRALPRSALAARPLPCTYAEYAIVPIRESQSLASSLLSCL